MRDGVALRVEPNFGIAGHRAGRRLRKRSFCQAVHQAPLRSAGPQLGRENVNALTFKRDQSVGQVRSPGGLSAIGPEFTGRDRPAAS